MTCEQFWKGEPGGVEHLRECPECSLRFERQERLAAALKRTGAEMRSIEAPDVVERRLVSVFRARAALAAPVQPAGLWWSVGSWAAAAAVTVGIALFLVGGRQPERTERLSRRATQLASVEAPAAPVDDDGFIQLPNTESLAPHEPVNLVRIEIPRSTLVALGFELPEDAAEEAVEADVMLGPDGTARALRVLE